MMETEAAVVQSRPKRNKRAEKEETKKPVVVKRQVKTVPSLPAEKVKRKVVTYKK
jgi:hypothetical protein